MPCGLLTEEILRACTDKNVGGIEIDILIFNTDDIDRNLTTFDATSPNKITNFALKAGKTGYLYQSIKQVSALKFELVVKEFSENLFKHTFAGVIPNVSNDNKDRLLELTNGSVAVMVRTKFKGTNNADEFHLAGYFSGLKMATVTYASNENDGTIAFEIASEEGYEEPTPILTVLETDNATTLTSWNNKFATAGGGGG